MFARRYFARRYFARHYWGDGPDASIYSGPRPEPRWSTIQRVAVTGGTVTPDPRWSTIQRAPVEDAVAPDPRWSTITRN